LKDFSFQEIFLVGIYGKNLVVARFCKKRIKCQLWICFCKRTVL